MINRIKESFKELGDFRPIQNFRNPVEVFTEAGRIKMNNLHTNKPQDAQSIIDSLSWNNNQASKPKNAKLEALYKEMNL